MKNKSVSAVASIVLAASAVLVTGQASAADVPEGQQPSSTVTASAALDRAGTEGPVPSSLSRASVRAMAVAVNRTHPLTGEAGADLAVWDDTASTGLTRAQVRAEVRAARADGTLAGPGDLYDDFDAKPVATTGHDDPAQHPHLAKVGQWLRSL